MEALLTGTELLPEGLELAVALIGLTLGGFSKGL